MAKRTLIVELPDDSAEVDFLDAGAHVQITREQGELRIVVKVFANPEDSHWALHEFSVPLQVKP